MSNFKFSEQNRNEEIKLVIRHHPWYFFKPFCWSLIPLIIILITFYKAGASIYSSYALGIGLFIIVYIWLGSWVCWSKTIYLLTNQRIISVTQESWFTREVAESNLELILFISHKISGPLRTLLNMGSIHIRTSGVVEEEIVLKDISNPYEVQRKIVETQKEYTGKKADIRSEDEVQKDFLEKDDDKDIKSDRNKKKTIIR